MKKVWLFLVVVVLFLAACGQPTNVVQEIESDNGLHWQTTEEIKKELTDTKIYVLTVKIGQPVQSKDYQSAPAEAGYFRYDTYASGSYRGPEIVGKGLTYGEILDSNDQTVVENGTFIMLKLTDLKASALPDGAIVTVSCTRDYEVVSPVMERQDWNEDAITWEMDECRLTNPYIKFEK